MNENYTNIINKTVNEQLIRNVSSEILLDNTTSKYLFLGIIIILLILLIISILILSFLFLKKKKVESISNHNMILNRIILKHPNNDISLKGHPKGFQRLQNTSNVSNSNIQPQNNIFNEIKSENLKDEIHKIINTSSSLDSGRRKRKKNNSDLELNKSENKDDNKSTENNKEILSDINKEANNNDEIKNQEKQNINTQELEKEIKQQIKKYVIEENDA